MWREETKMAKEIKKKVSHVHKLKAEREGRERKDKIMHKDYVKGRKKGRKRGEKGVDEGDEKMSGKKK